MAVACFLPGRAKDLSAPLYEASALKQDIKFSFHVLSNSVLAKIQTSDAIDSEYLILSLSYRSVLSEVWICL